MATGVWQPAKGNAPATLDLAALRACATLMEQGSAGPEAKDKNLQLQAHLSSQQIQDNSHWMRQDEAYWQPAEVLQEQELVALVRFFTLAEMQLPGWAAGKQSPVIYLVRLLKQRQAFAPALRQWIKANTDNRYLPNGALL
jgi:hypothetical protein